MWRLYPVGDCYDICWITGLWSTQTKVEVSCRGLHGTGVNDPLGEPGCNPLYVVHPCAWGSVDGELMFSPILYEGSFCGTPADKNE